MNSVSIEVSTEVLKRQSAEVTRKVQSMRRHFGDLEEQINKTGGYWVGEAGDKHRKMYRDLKEDVEKMLRRLEEYPANLLAVAQQDESTEISLEAEMDALPWDVIE